MRNIHREVVNSRMKTTKSELVNGEDSATLTGETRIEDNLNSSDAIIVEKSISSHPASDATLEITNQGDST